MELHLALKNIVSINGASILKEKRLVNILADYNAYNDVPSSKFIIKTIIDMGYMEKFVVNGKWDLNSDKIIEQFILTTGMMREFVVYVFKSVGSSLGWKNMRIAIPLYRNSVKKKNTKSPLLVDCLNCEVDVINPGLDIFKLTLQKPTVALVGKGKIMVACEVHGPGNGYYKFPISCSIYVDDCVVQVEKITSICFWNYTEFTIVSKEIKLKCKVQDVTRVVVYRG